MSPVLVVITTTLILGLLLLQFLLRFYTCVFFYVNLLACRKHLHVHVHECALLRTLLFEYVHAIITLRACTRGKVIGSVRLSAQKNVRSRHSDVTSSQ